MNIPKTIEILNDRLTQGRRIEGPDLLDAIKLGSEALEAYKAFRLGDTSFNYPTLPSETED